MRQNKDSCHTALQQTIKMNMMTDQPRESGSLVKFESDEHWPFTTLTLLFMKMHFSAFLSPLFIKIILMPHIQVHQLYSD